MENKGGKFFTVGKSWEIGKVEKKYSQVEDGK